MTDPLAPRTALALSLIAAGVLWLLVQVGFVPAAVLVALWRLWPLLLIGVGLDVAAPGRRPLGVPFTALAAGIVVLAALFMPVDPNRANAEETSHVPLAGTTTASVTMELPSSATEIGSTSAPDTLLTMTTVGNPKALVDVRGGPSRVVTIKPQAGLPSFGRGRWALQLSDAVPLKLAIDAGSGAAQLALGALQIQELVLDLGSGASAIALPQRGDVYDVHLDAGSGATRLQVPTGASVNIRAETGSGATSIDIEPGSDVRLVLRAGSGSVRLALPPDAPILLEVMDDGSGSLRVPDYLRRSSGSGDTGSWRSANYPDGGRAIHIRIEKAGSGSIRLQ